MEKRAANGCAGPEAEREQELPEDAAVVRWTTRLKCMYINLGVLMVGIAVFVSLILYYLLR